ncbi:hypothetical protein [Nocardia mexicana]|uniref:hypothetical protein n=1 Tax=Nocardia mexicana TaxID=279262 RepID=UPI0011C0308A|nr:hypothetical protein [Nocardia mexicana]
MTDAPRAWRTVEAWRQLADRTDVVLGDHVRASIPFDKGLVDYELKELRADSDAVEYDGRRMRWSDVDWVMYKRTQTQQKGPALNVTVSRSNQVTFAVGNWARDGESEEAALKSALMVSYVWNGNSDLPAEPWLGLVSLSRAFLEPRLIDEILQQVRAGQRAHVIDADVDVDADGFYFLDQKQPLRRFSDVYVKDEPGEISIYPIKGFRGGVSLDKNCPNAMLLPVLYNALTTPEQRASADEEMKDPPWLKWVILGVLVVVAIVVAVLVL